ncbi:MAG: sn-glycerol-3-phosphate ABC transporter ATP-binding protein UgpC [Fibrobacterota bacterium]|nr:sn-glycerol-3-phosphate ABC transporter ATP-binding protein UgpC [Fibrobacterota bacterium]
MAEVILKSINKVYDGGVVAVKDLSFEVKDKEFLVLVGPSGCGKSTLLRMIAGLEEITSGELYIGGKLCNDVAPKDRDIAMVFQNYALYPHMTVEENLAFGLKLRKLPKEEIKRRVGEAAEMLGITPYLSRKPKALSGGQRQRVALGRAIVRKPKVFLFDEPLSNLDAKMRVQMRVEISRLSAQLQTTMIYVTHDQTEAMTMGHRIVCMKDGIIQQSGTPMELYRRPRNIFVAGFIGMPPMNFLPCEWNGEALMIPGAGATGLSAGDFQVRPPARPILGVRPEHLRLERSANDGAKGIAAEVEVVEPLGAETLVYCRAGQHRAVARIHPETIIGRGDKVTLIPEPANMHFFDP